MFLAFNVITYMQFKYNSVFGDTLTFNNISYGVISGQYLFIFIFGRPIVRKTVKYIELSDNSFRCVLSLMSNRSGFGRLLVGSFTLDVTLYRMTLDVCVFPIFDNM